MFELFLEQESLADRVPFGREADGTPAAPWGWEDLDLWLVPQIAGAVRRPARCGLTADPAIRKVSLDSSLSGRSVAVISKPSSALRLLALFDRTGQPS